MVQIITDFLPALAAQLPETHQLLIAAHLTLHAAVLQVTLVGSRGLAGGYHAASDIDLSLMVDVAQLPATEPERDALLREILTTTLTTWQAPVELDVAAVFDLGNCCGLRCFRQQQWEDAIIGARGKDCFGVYKVQRGFDGYVTQGVNLAAMYPMLAIWQRDQ